MWKKIIVNGVEAQKKFLKGIEVVDKMVGDTLGPSGRNRLLPMKYKSPWVINDGMEIARRIVLDDPIEDLAAQTIIEVSQRTAEQAGDGTTGSVVIASEIARHCLGKMIKEGNEPTFLGSSKSNPMQMWRDIQSEKDKAVEILKTKFSKELKDKDLDNIISTSLENLEYGQTLGKLLREIGIDGYVSVEDNWATKYGITTEMTTGMRFLGKMASPYLANTSNGKEAIWEESHILVTNHKIEHENEIKPLLEDLIKNNIRKVIIISGYSEGESGYSKRVIEMLARECVASRMQKEGKITSNNPLFEILAIKAPSLTSSELEDVSTFVGATFIDKNLGIQMQSVRTESLGFAKKISVTEDEVNLIGGKGDVKDRIEVLKKQIELEKDVMFQEKLKRRVASLASGVGIIRVGAQTESERAYLKEKLKDAVSAAKVAQQEGYVKGGGQTLAEIAKILGKDSILYTALKAPFERIQKNAGVVLDIPKTVVDPTKVIRLALENACSGAGMLITSDGAIADQKLTYGDFLEKALSKHMSALESTDDWRDESNRDLGRGSNIN